MTVVIKIEIAVVLSMVIFALCTGTLLGFARSMFDDQVERELLINMILDDQHTCYGPKPRHAKRLRYV